jgi:hypothetical protein
MHDERSPRRHDVRLTAANSEDEHGDWCAITVIDSEGVCLGQVEIGTNVEGGIEQITVTSVTRTDVEVETLARSRDEVRPR